MQGTIDHGAMLGENLAPVSEELWVVVLSGKMGLEARPDIYVHSVRILMPWTRHLPIRGAGGLTAGLLGQQ